MNKTELINAVAESANLTKKQAEAAVNAFTASVAASLKKGEDVQIIGFGTFKVRERGERIGRNIKTGEKITIAASKAPAFVAGKGLKDAIK